MDSSLSLATSATALPTASSFVQWMCLITAPVVAVPTV